MSLFRKSLRRNGLQIREILESTCSPREVPEGFLLFFFEESKRAAVFRHTLTQNWVTGSRRIFYKNPIREVTTAGRLRARPDRTP